MSDLKPADQVADGKPEQTTTTTSSFVFGSNSNLPSGGFGGVISGQPEAGSSGTATLGASANTSEQQGDDNVAHTGEEDCSLEYAPVVQLEEVQTTTGEEAEQNIFDCKTKLYRFDQAGNEWKERGVGTAKILKHKENGKVRFLFREDKTLKIRANHLIMPGTNLQNHAGSEKAIVWSAVDFADEEQKVELLCLRFGSEEKASYFKQTYEGSMGVNQKLLEKDAADGAVVIEDVNKKEGEKKGEVVEKLADQVDKEVKVTEE